MEELSYGISLSYQPRWGKWEVIRELWANAHDTGKPFDVRLEGASLVIEDQGDGIKIVNLLLGEHAAQSSDTIGQFGEGLKLAMLVCVREGLPMMVETGQYLFVPGKKTMMGTDVLKVDIDTVSTPRQGTRITIDSWGDDLYEDRFILSEEDPKVMFTLEGGSVLYKKAIFNKGVFVQDAPQYRFGYDLLTLAMNRDRSAVSESETHTGIGRVWARVDWAGAWEAFFRACIDRKGESKIDIWSYNHEILPAVKQGWIACFGEKSCLESNETASTECKHRGVNVVPSSIFGWSVECLIKSADIPTDESWLKANGVRKYRAVSDRTLTPDQKKVLALLRKMGKKVLCSAPITVAELPNGALGEYDGDENSIRINKDVLDAEETAQRVAVHELAHALYGHRDMTEEFNADCCRVGVLLMK